MYEGSPNVARGEYKDLIGAAAGNMDGSVTPDVYSGPPCRPTSSSWRRFSRRTEIAFDNFANQQSGWGTPEELNRATVADVRAFYQTYYAPSNAGLVLVGDFDPAKARERIRYYFESIPKRAAPPRRTSASRFAPPRNARWPRKLDSRRH
jgi:predicted Zn-dependent peptidase